MEYPTQYVLKVSRFFDGLIAEHGHYLFMGFAVLCFVFLIWLFTRRRKQPVRDFPVMIVPLGNSPKREPEPESVLFRESSDS